MTMKSGSYFRVVLELHDADSQDDPRSALILEETGGLPQQRVGEPPTKRAQAELIALAMGRLLRLAEHSGHMPMCDKFENSSTDAFADGYDSADDKPVEDDKT